MTGTGEPRGDAVDDRPPVGGPRGDAPAPTTGECSAGDGIRTGVRPRTTGGRPAQGDVARKARLALAAFLAVYGVICMTSPGTGRLLDGVDLAIHETGHLVFAPFGEFMGFLGGTLFQLILPIAFVAHFLRRGDRYAGGVVLWWVAQNLWNISVYAADARSRRLPLVGGGEHDWTYILLRLGLLEHDQTVAKLFHFAGILVFGAAMLMAFSHAGGAAAPVRAASRR